MFISIQTILDQNPCSVAEGSSFGKLAKIKTASTHDTPLTQKEIEWAIDNLPWGDVKWALKAVKNGDRELRLFAKACIVHDAAAYAYAAAYARELRLFAKACIVHDAAAYAYAAEIEWQKEELKKMFREGDNYFPENLK